MHILVSMFFDQAYNNHNHDHNVSACGFQGPQGFQGSPGEAGEPGQAVSI